MFAKWDRGRWRWGFLGVVGVLLTACAGGSTSAIVATATPLCHASTPQTSTIGTVTTADPLSPTIATVAGTTQTIHYASGAQFSQMVPSATTALVANTPVQVVVQPSSANAIPLASAIIIQQSTTATDAPSRCVTTQTTIPGVQGQINTVNTNSQQITLTDNQGHLYVVAFSGATIIGQLAAAQPTDVAVGDLVLAVGTMATNGFDAQSVIILQTGT